MISQAHDRILVIIPAYNAQDSLEELVGRIASAVPDAGILIVDDGSRDKTAEVAGRSGALLLKHPENRGKGAALKTGFQYALQQGYRAVVTIDADLQHLPEEIPRFLDRHDGKSVLIGTRRIDTEVMPFGRWVSNNWTSIIVSIFSSRRVRDSQSGFRLIPAAALTALDLESDRYDMESELLFKAGALGLPIREVPVSTVYGPGRSYIAPFKDTGRFIRLTWKRIWM